MSVDETAQFHVYIDPACLAHAPAWSDAVRDAGFDFLIEGPLDLGRADGSLRCWYRGEEMTIAVRREALGQHALLEAGVEASRSLRLVFGGVGPARVPALIFAGVACARLEGTLIEPAGPEGAARVDALGAVTWAADLETLADEQYRREHDGRQPPALLARRRSRRRAFALPAALVIAVAGLIWAGLRVHAYYEKKQEEKEMRAYLDRRAGQIAEEERQEQASRAAAQAAREAVQAKAVAEAAALEARIARLSDDDYAFVSAEAPAGRKRWLFGYRQGNGHYAFDARGECGKELLHSPQEALFPASYVPPPGETGLPAVTVPALALAPLRTAREHLPREWTLVTTEGIRKIEMAAQATAFSSAFGPCLYLLSAPFTAQKQKRFGILGERLDHSMQVDDLALAWPGELHETALRRAGTMHWLREGEETSWHQHEVDEGMGLLKSDARLRALLRQAQAESQNAKLQMRVAGYQDFRAAFSSGHEAEMYRLYFFRSTGEPAEFWALMRMNDSKVVAVPTLRNSFVPELAAIVDIDGDGIDELLFRAYLYDEGKQLKLLKLEGGRLRQLAASTYTGL